MQTADGIYQATSDEEKAAIYRLRYDIYVEEMQRYRSIADHENRWLVEPVDEQSRLFYAMRNGELAGTMRLTWGGDAPLPERQVEQYAIAPFQEELPDEAIIVSERFMVTPPHRGSDLLFRLFTTYFALVNEKRVQLMIGDCEPHLLNVYQALGFRTYASTNINSPEAGYLIPLVIVAEDVDYLRRLKSPLAEVAADFGEDIRIPPCIETLVNKPTAVMSERLVSIGDYWQEVYRSLSDLEAHRVSLFDGLDDDQTQRCLAKSNIIDCRPGDRILKKGNTAQNLFVLLSGVLEVRDGDKVVAVLKPGEVFGEIAFLLGRPRGADVYAVGADTRVLSLSEAVIRKLVETEPDAAAGLLLNISKMLCWRLVRDSQV